MKRMYIILIFALGFGQINWEFEIVDTAGEALGLYNSLALDSIDTPHIVYSDIGELPTDTTFIIHAFKVGTIWQKEIVDSSPTAPPNGFSSPCHGLSLAIDKNDHLHLSYFRYDSLLDMTKLCYGYCANSQWTVTVLDSFAGYTRYSRAFNTSIVLDTLDLPGIAYSYLDVNDSLQYIKLLHYNGLTWDVYVIDDGCDSWDYGPSLQFDKKNQPHVAFYQDDSLKYAYYDTQTSNWIFAYLMSTGTNTHASLSLVLDNQDYPRIAHTNGFNLVYTWWNDSTWLTEYVDDTGIFEIEIDLELDSLENPHIAYTEEFNFKVDYCYKDSIWHIIRWIDTTGHTLEDVSMELDRFDNPHIAYELDWMLKYAKGTFDGGIEELKGVSLVEHSELQVTPNPFNQITEIRYQIGDNSHVSLTIYNTVGQHIKTLVDTPKSSGSYTIRWDRKNNLGKNVPEGIYFCYFKTEKFRTTQKMILLK